MNSLTKIKKIINSMEFQIKDDDINEFQKQIADLEPQLVDNTPAASFVKMMRSIGNYLKSETNNAHKDTVPALLLLAEQLDTLVKDPEISPEKAHEMLTRGIQSFKTLKTGIYATPVLSEKDIELLKTVILSIDWEISDTTLKNFDTVVKQLITKLKPHKIHFSFLKIIQSIGGYVTRNKANAHKNSLGLLRSVFQDYEHMLQNPDMTFADKKEILELAIKKFQEFKSEIARPEKALFPQDSADEEVMPALSHVKFSPSTGDLVPLSKLPEQEIFDSDSSLVNEEITPALAGKEKHLYNSRDMMDDLFTAKESPTDELLDAIHLSELQGPEQEYGTGIFGAVTGQDQKEGVKNFIPQRMNKEPIPEIESRLDEFFNLADSGNKIKTPDYDTGQTDPTMDDDQILGKSPGVSVPLAASDHPDVPEANEEEAEAIVPFEYEDESFLEDEEDQAGTILKRLKASLKTPDRIADPPALSDFMKDLYLLKEKWKDDWEKVLLVGMLVSLAEYIYNPEKDNILESRFDTETQMNTEDEEKTTDSAKPPAKGVWVRIKSIFSS